MASDESIFTGGVTRRVDRITQFVERRCGLFVAAGMGIVLAAGAVYALLLGPTLRFPDEEGYNLLATHLVAEQSYSFDGEHATAFQPPGYPFFLAAFKLLGADVVALRVVNFFLLAAGIYLVYRILATYAARSSAARSTTAACNWLRLRNGAVHPSR